MGGWRPTYLDESKNVPEFRNVWEEVLNGRVWVGGWGAGWRGFLLPVKKWMTSSDSREENASYSSKNWIGWCWNNWRKGKRGPWVCETIQDQRDFLFNTTPFFSIFWFSFSPFTPPFLSPESTLRPSLILLLLHHFPLCLFYPIKPPIPPLLPFVCGPEGWIRMSDRKRSHFLTSLLPLPFARFLEFHLILYSAQSVQYPSTFSCWEYSMCVAWWGEHCSCDVLDSSVSWPSFVYFFCKTMEDHVYSFQRWERNRGLH